MDRMRPLEGAERMARPLLAIALVALAACGGGGGGPRERLLDGSRPQALPAALRSLGGHVVATKARVVSVRDAEPRLRACIRRFAPLRVPARTAVVERTGLLSASATFEIGTWVYGCDATAGPQELPGPWCGGETGRTDLPRFDARVDILCVDAEKRPVGLAWIAPVAGARYVVVRDHDYAEVYEAASGLPVRVATHNVDVETSSATFSIEQYDSLGRRLSRRRLRAAVAG
jgi:hypothetical protein